MQERRSRFLINKPLQLRYMAYIVVTFLAVTAVIIVSLYFGIWGGILDAFSDEQIRNDLLIATRLSQYESARVPPEKQAPSSLSFFKQAERLSQRQQEVFKNILDDTNRQLVPKFLVLLFLISWGSIYLSHKIAGPLYRFHVSLEEIEKGNMRTRIHLRRTDEAQLLGSQFNQTIEHMDFTFARLKNILAENEKNPERLTSRLKEELAKIKTSADR